MEDSLRTMFASQVKDAPVLDDPAAVAIRRSRRARRARHLSAGLGSMLALAVLAGGMVSIRDWWEQPTTSVVTSPIVPPPEPAAHETEPWSGNPLGVQIRLINRVWTADGQRLLLSGSALVEQAYHTPHGLVYGNEGEIRLLPPDGAVVELASDPGQWRVSPDAQQVAWVAGGVARVAPLDADGLGRPEQVHVPQGTSPVAFWSEKVVLAGPDGQGYDVWDPASLDYEPVWNDQVVSVYGQFDDDLVVLVGEPEAYCVALVRVDADGVRPDLANDCDPLPAAAELDGWLAPDGQWLAVAAGKEILLVHLPTLRDGDSILGSCPRSGSVLPAWLNDTTLLTADGSEALTCDVAGSVEQLSTPEQLGTRWEYVPMLGGHG